MKETLKRILVASVFGFTLVLIVSYIFALYYQHPIQYSNSTVLTTIILFGLIVEGIQFINRKIDKKYNWAINPAKRFWLQLIVNLAFVITMLSVFGTIIILFVAQDPMINIFDLFIVNSVGVALISIYVFISLNIFLLNNWRRSLVEVEKLKNKDAEAKFESLKNQLSPHFLFNNLNMLHSLIPDDATQASDYVIKLSELYRYILKLKDQEIVGLDQEVEFIKNYVFLLSVRYGTSFQVEFDLKKKMLNEKFLPPFTLQLLIENAEKHNIIDENHVMGIQVFSEDNEYVVVKNSLLTAPEKKTSTRVGLENLKSRYRFLTEKKVCVEKSLKHFVVKVPLLDVKQIELM